MTDSASQAVPGSTGEKSGPVEAWILVVSCFLVLGSGLVYVTIGVGARSFAELLAGFGAELPVLTRIGIDYSRYATALTLIGLLPTIVLFVRRKSFPGNASRYFLWVAGSFVLSLVILGIWVIAMYLPIFKLGATV